MLVEKEERKQEREEETLLACSRPIRCLVVLFFPAGIQQAQQGQMPKGQRQNFFAGLYHFFFAAPQFNSGSRISKKYLSKFYLHYFAINFFVRRK